MHIVRKVHKDLRELYRRRLLPHRLLQSEQLLEGRVLKRYVSGVGADAQLNAQLLERMRSSCTHDSGGFIFFHLAVRDALDLMAASDWASLIFAVAIIALQVSAEQRDVLLCQLIREQCTCVMVEGSRAGSEPSEKSAAALRPWVAALALVGDIRYVCSLVLVCTASGLVLYRGSDALNICLNALAVLFVLEAYNIIYSYGLSDQLKDAFEDGLQRLTLGSSDKARLEAMRAAQLVLVPFLCIGIILLVGRSADQNINHSVLIAVLAVAPGSVEAAFGVHSTARTENPLLLMCRRLAAVLLVSVAASLVPRIDRGHFYWPPAVSDIFIAGTATY